jgi:hypothetical protein
MQTVREHFDTPLGPLWHEWLVGDASITMRDSTLRMAIGAVSHDSYANSQLDDYGKRHGPFAWRPPLRMRVRARSSHPAWPPHVPADTASDAYLRGTAGFGFWNAGLSPGGKVLSLPDAVWFFAASRPSEIALVPDVPGWGWKAQVVHANRASSALQVVPTLATVAMARLGGPLAPAERWVRKLSGAHEAQLTASLRDWHTYELDWLPETATFRVDGVEVLHAPGPPRGPLGFVTWIDNQFAVVTPRGELRFGFVDTSPQWLELDSLEITPLG